MKTTFTIDQFSMEMEHSERYALDRSAEQVICIIEQRGEADTLSELVVWYVGRAVSIAVHWSTRYVGSGFQVFLIPETEIIFVGAGTLSAVIDLRSEQVLDEKSVNLFWAFERQRDYVLELGELACYPYDRHGRLLGEVPVDPPYDILEIEHSLKFTSDVMGSHWHAFPAQE